VSRRRFRVWAPNVASTVELVLDGGAARHAMEPTGGGWFEAVAEGVGSGARYALSLDGGPARPDPRSPSQPDGVDAPSEVVDHAAFEWTDDGWPGSDLRSAVVYELHVGTFTPGGTFVSAIDRLPHLVELGVDAVEVMPVAEFSGDRGWGYDGVDLYAPHHAYGGPDGFKRFVDAAHQAGIAVVLDVVYNHLGPAGNYLAEFGPYFTDRYETLWGQAVNLDGPGSGEVRRFFVDDALMWLRDYHLDGLRLDAVHAMFDASPTHFLAQLADEVGALSREVGRPLWLVAESEEYDPRIVTSRERGGYGIDAQWHDHFHHALHALMTGERAGYYAPFGSVARVADAFEGPGPRYVVCMQNHDQVGNRAQGDRTSHLLTVDQLKVAAALVLTAPFVPMLFMGEEWGASTPFPYFTDHRDPDLARAVSEGRRDEFGAFGWKPEDVPDPQARSTFDAAVLRWDELEREPHRSLLAWHRSLIRLRRADPRFGAAQEHARVEWADDERGRWVVVDRGSDALVVANLSDDHARIPLPSGARERGTLASSTDGAHVAAGGAELPPWSVVVLG
jgi:maltooligosyltrehalose trehalohydrolase